MTKTDFIKTLLIPGPLRAANNENRKKNDKNDSHLISSSKTSNCDQTHSNNYLNDTTSDQQSKSSLPFFVNNILPSVPISESLSDTDIKFRNEIDGNLNFENLENSIESEPSPIGFYVQPKRQLISPLVVMDNENVNVNANNLAIASEGDRNSSLFDNYNFLTHRMHSDKSGLSAGLGLLPHSLSSTTKNSIITEKTEIIKKLPQVSQNVLNFNKSPDQKSNHPEQQKIIKNDNNKLTKKKPGTATMSLTSLRYSLREFYVFIIE